MASSPAIVRPLGDFERYMEADYFLDYLRSNCFSCRYNLPGELVDSSTDEDVHNRFIQALARTIIDNPMLHAVLVNAEGKRPKFARLEELNLHDMVEWRVISKSEDYSQTTDMIINQQVDQVFSNPDTLPGWRILVTRLDGESFLDVHLMVRHTMLDGDSRKILNTSLLGHLNSPIENKEQQSLVLHGHTLKIPSQGPAFPPPMEKYGDFSLGLKFILSLAWQELRPGFLQKPSATAKAWGPFKVDDYKTERRTIRINPEHTQKLIQRCRAHQTTITGFLHGAILASLMWECSDTVQSQSYSATSAVNLRRFMPDRPKAMSDTHMDPAKTIVNMLTVIDHEFDVKSVQNLLQLIKPTDEKPTDCRHYEDIVWATAVETRSSIQKKLNKGLKNDVMGALKLVSDWRSEKKASWKKPRRESWTLTNLGVFDGQKPTNTDEKRNNWHVDHVLFAPSVDVSRSLFMISAISVKDGDMCIGIAWQSGLGEYVDTVGNRLTRDIYSWCNYIATSEWSDDWVQRSFA
ncbi:hypothetical protein FSARC_10439 [Fusarium sarcochroum]|uniref:Alcohol acetyltransferase n=1 Tax=Fusarium sarcochroum TaxID=1208366 RepID=A0A8H4X3K3_9HYPO|nr:hypothetical protein FSARC_10439 [Fusarium sarcochroum]